MLSRVACMLYPGASVGHVTAVSCGSYISEKIAAPFGVIHGSFMDAVTTYFKF
jgi:hypothetical protein